MKMTRVAYRETEETPGRGAKGVGVEYQIDDGDDPVVVLVAARQFVRRELAKVSPPDEYSVALATVKRLRDVADNLEAEAGPPF